MRAIGVLPYIGIVGRFAGSRTITEATMRTIPTMPLVFLALLVLALGSCSKDQEPAPVPSSSGPPPPEFEYYTESGYLLDLFTIAGEGEAKTLIGEHDIDGNWIQELGLIYLGADDVHEPLGTLTLTIDTPEVGKHGYQARILSATLSTTDVRVGTAAELNARLYELIPDTFTTEPNCSPAFPNHIRILALSDEQIQAYISLFMERVIVNPETPAETIKVCGHFGIVD